MPSTPRLRILTLLLLATAAPPLRAQNASLRAHVTTAPDSAAGTVVWVGNLSKLTDRLGMAEITDIPPGNHLVRFRRDGYRTESALLEFRKGAHVEVDVDMLPAVNPIEIAPITALAERQTPYLRDVGFYERKKAGMGTFVERDEIARWSASRDLAPIFGAIPGFGTRPTLNGNSHIIYSTRGVIGLNSSNECQPAWIVDGTPARPGFADFSPIHIEAIEAYAGPATTPAQYVSGPNGSSCGTIVIWTRAGTNRK